MPLSAEQMRQAIQARRLQDDEALQAVLDRIREEAKNHAVYLDNPGGREGARMLVLAVDCLRATLQGDAEAPEAERAAETLARSLE
jgi:hypothetical protein